MASSPQAARLTEAHRLAQTRLGAQTAQQMTDAWSVLDPARIDATVEAWLRVSVPVLQNQRATSARLAGAYLRAFRTLEVGEEIAPTLAAALDPAQTATSLLVTGPVKVKQATARGVPLDAASVLGRESSARAGMRLALAGGRSTITSTLTADPQAHGWARVTSGSPCAFCDMLASRGPVYGEASADFEAHDGCSCTAEPVYNHDAAWPPGAREARAVWDESTRGLTGAEALAAFRRARG